MNITDIQWPIYYIGQHDRIYTEFNVTYLENKGRTFIIDNKNLAGDTLGSRRLRVKKEDLYNFRKTLFMFSELIEFTRTKKIIDRRFYDSKGNMFLYRKSLFVPLKCFAILYVEDYPTYKLISVKGLKQRFRIPNNYWNFRYNFLQALALADHYILYDLSMEAIKDTRRKI